MLQYPEYQNLANTYKIYLPNWFMPCSDLSFLKYTGFAQYKITKLDGKHDYCWIQERFIHGDKIFNQTIDHYVTLIQLAAWAIRNWIGILELNINPQVGGADVIIQIKNDRYAFEYERSGSNSTSDLYLKKRSIINKGQIPIFITQSSNFKYVSNAVGDCAVQRGMQLMDKLKQFEGQPISAIKYRWIPPI